MSIEIELAGIDMFTTEEIKLLLIKADLMTVDQSIGDMNVLLDIAKRLQTIIAKRQEQADTLEPYRLFGLRLEYLGEDTHDLNRWVATYNSVGTRAGDHFWHELERIKSYPASGRGMSPAIAVARATLRTVFILEPVASEAWRKRLNIKTLLPDA